jgi:asparagine synthase (glutamine-hydrolysing)
VVFNGEIYNYQELIPELQALGHVFHTKSDTEVIVHAWESWGARLRQRFRGMFAFALWDRNQQTLFMARDRMGVKPMYYALLDDGSLLFGSELKSIMAHGGCVVTSTRRRSRSTLRWAMWPSRARSSSRPQAAAGAHAAIQRGQPLPQPVEYWDVRFTLDNPIQAEAARPNCASALKESVKPAHDCGGAAGCVPVGRGRLQRRGGLPWRGLSPSR